MTTPRQTVTATQRSTIKTHLMTGATISTWEAYERYQITSLAQRIYDLRKAGMTIHSKSTVKNGKRFNLYWIDEAASARDVSGKVNAADYDVWVTNAHEVLVTHAYIDNLLSTLTESAKAINILAKSADIEDAEDAAKINNYSMEVSDIAMRLTQAASEAGLHSDNTDISGTWLAHDCLEKLKLSIDGSSKSLGAMTVKPRLIDAGVSDGVSEASMMLSEISASIAELITND